VTVSERLRAELRAQGGPLAQLVETRPASVGRPSTGPAQLAAAGPRAASHETEYELLLEMILEGSRLHYGDPGLVETDDPDLALLLGDQLYALGLARLAALGDLPAVTELADVISMIAQAHAEADDVLAAAVWEAGAVAIGWGSSPAHERAKELARAGAPGAAAELTDVARAQQHGGS
jgi:hypothetical protein